ncbi:hypothetical protein NWE47_15035 [Escherichia coli]|nr:hypothetical protein [Escherichia coli]
MFVADSRLPVLSRRSAERSTSGFSSGCGRHVLSAGITAVIIQRGA